MCYLEINSVIEELEKNEQRILEVCDRIASIPKKDFMDWFPSSYGMQIVHEDWGLRLISSPALPRRNNNCWSIIRQMELWKRWFRGLNLRMDQGQNQRYVAEIWHHTNANLPFVPNPIEAHPMIDGLTSILGIDDNMTNLDFKFGVVPGPEYCEIRIGCDPGKEGFPSPDFGAYLPLEPVRESDFEARIQEMCQSFLTLNNKEIMGLYYLLLMKDCAIRSKLHYSILTRYYPLRRRKGTSVTAYQRTLKENPLRIVRKNDVVSIVSNAPFRSYEQRAADLFLQRLYRCLQENTALLESLSGRKNRLSIFQKRAKPDGDNVPFDSIFKVIQTYCTIPLEPVVSVSYAPQMEHGICISIAPSETVGTTP